MRPGPSAHEDRLRDHAPERWWESFFGPDYLVLYGAELTPKRSAREVEGIMRAIGLKPGESVLDVCCGFGRHMRWLQALGMRVTGLDLSPVQLSLARETAGLSAPLRLVRGDSRRLPFTSAFDAALCLYTSVGYFSDADNLRQIREVARVLKPGGRLFLDNQNPVRVLRNLRPERRIEDPATGAAVVERLEYDPATRRVYSRKELTTPGGRRAHWFVLRAYHADEMAGLLEQCGLAVQATYGDFDLRPYGDDTERLILTARKERAD